MIERAGRVARPHFLGSASPCKSFARPVPVGRAKAGRSDRPQIGAAAYGRRAAARNGVAHDFAFHRSSSCDILKYIPRSFRHGSNRQAISERQKPSRAPAA